MLLSSCSQLSVWKQRREAPPGSVVDGMTSVEGAGQRVVETPAEAIDEARELRDQGNWTEAIKALDAAGRDFPQNQEIQTALQELKTSWRKEKRLLDDRMLVLDTTSLTAKLPLLELRSKGEPENISLKSRLLFWKKYLQSQVDPLISCGVTHGGKYLWLARRCLRLADEIAPSPYITKLLEENSGKIELMHQAISSREEKKEELERVQQVQALLEGAEQDMQRGEYSNALRKLNRALGQDPENRRVRKLLSKAQSELDLQISSLVKLGDNLYQEEQIGPAVKVWETALRLDPTQDGIEEKINRARRVLEKLEAIRSRESPPPAKQ